MHSIKLFLTISVVTVAIAAMVLSGGSCSAEDTEDRDMRSMDGNITEVDTFNSTITVKWQDQNLIGYNYTTFAIPEGMTFYKGSDTVDIFDLNIGDPVTIEYYIDKTGTSKIVRLQTSQE